jgi:hypothetical protein
MAVTQVKLHGIDKVSMSMLTELHSNLLRLAETVDQPIKLLKLINSFGNGRLASNLKPLTTGRRTQSQDRPSP